MVSQFSEPQSICILRLSAIGDVCHAVATVQAIQKKWPETKITWVIGKVEKMLIDNLPGVDFIVFEKNTGIAGYKQLRNQLKAYRFDILLHMQAAFRASLISTFIHAKEKWGFDRKNAREGQWLFTNRKVPYVESPHVADGFIAFAKAIGVAADYQLSWQMPLSSQDRNWQHQQLSDSGKYVVISPAASKAERNWLAERYASIAQYANQKNFKVVICGGPAQLEKQLAKQIAEFCDFELINLVGKTSLKQMLAVLEKAELVIAPDTGPAHMAVTVGTPVIGLYVHSNPKRTGPYRYLDYVVSHYTDLVKEQTGKTVEESEWGTRVKGPGLMSRITVDEVEQMFDKVLSDKVVSDNR